MASNLRDTQYTSTNRESSMTSEEISRIETQLDALVDKVDHSMGSRVEDFESAAMAEGLDWGSVKQAFVENPSEMHLVFERLQEKHQERVSGLGGLMGGFSVAPS
jgi:hypothetical protein